MQNQKSTQQETLIEALYDLALDPNNFESFTQAWEQYLLDYQLSDVETDISDRLARHFGRAFNILEKFGRDTAASDCTVQQLIERRATAAVALDNDGRLVSLNQAAIDLLKPEKDTKFARELIHTKSGESLTRSLERTLDNDGPLPIMVLLPNGQPALMVMQRLLDSDTIVIDVSGANWDSHVEQTLKSIYKLTDRECEIAASLFEGLSVNQIAEIGHRNLETVRKHTKSLLKKTQTHSQPKLMRLLTSLNFAGKDKNQPRWLNSQTNNYCLHLDDGRNLAYYDTGGKVRPTIVVLHGVLHDPELPPVMHQKLIQAGYRIVGVSRAWFGESSAPLSHNNVLERATSDLICVLDSLKIGRVTLLGNLAGAVHAYAISARYPERIERIVNIAGMVSLTNKTQIKAMHKGVRAVVYTAKYFPKLLPLFIRTAVAMVDSGDIRKLFETMYKGSALDLAAIQRDDIFERLVRGYNFASFYGHTAYSHEGIAISANMTEYLDKVKCRVDLIHGVHDGTTPIESVEDLSNQYENFTVQALEDAGQLMMYTAPNSVSEKLISILQS